MKRRGFLGLFGAAAVAGPSVAKNAIADTVVSSNAIPSLVSAGMGSYGIQTGTVSSMPSALTRMRELGRLISGEETAPEDPYAESEVRRRRAEFNVNSLGSISQSMKVQILVQRCKKIDQERQRKWWLMELLELQKGNR